MEPENEIKMINIENVPLRQEKIQNEECIEEVENEAEQEMSSSTVSEGQFLDLEGKFLHVTVGNQETPATGDQINDIRESLIDLFDRNNVNCLAFVTHHLVDMSLIEKK
ncbi:MAG: hypothetical protein J7L15_08950 [Clostridiales bacterium]|nr:hypothetical protein [Clostridiales bacterium]